MKKIFFNIGDVTIEGMLDGETQRGEKLVLLEEDENLIQETEWYQKGYEIFPFLDITKRDRIQSGINDLIEARLKELDIPVSKDFELPYYHHFVNDEQHLRFVKSIHLGWSTAFFPIPFQEVESFVSDKLKCNVTAKAKYTDLNNFFIRVVRPLRKEDNNPPHRDVWIDRLRDAVNVYLPICGSNENSSLGLVPGSHLISESQIERTANGALLNNTQYSVPCVVSINNKRVNMIRPNPNPEEIMLFSPYLVHGGGYNLNESETRISIEIRFWKK